MQSQGLDTELQYKPRMVHVFVVWGTVVLCCLTALIPVPHNPCALSSIAHFLPMTTCLQLLWKKEEEEKEEGDEGAGMLQSYSGVSLLPGTVASHPGKPLRQQPVSFP